MTLCQAVTPHLMKLNKTKVSLSVLAEFLGKVSSARL